MSTHLIVYGHGAGDPGAIGNGTNERDFNRQTFHPFLLKWANKLKNNKIVFWDTTGNKDLFQDTANGWGIYGMTSSQYTSITEFHLDAASATATGGHGIIYKTFNPDNFDLNTVIPIRDFIGWWGSVKNTQGINRRDNLLNCNVAAQRGINFRLIELGFITNSTDMGILIKNLDEIAKRMIEAITGEKIKGDVEEVKIVEKIVAFQGGTLKKKGVEYRSHLTNQGWLGFVSSGISGTTGIARSIEAIEVYLDGVQLNIEAHVAKQGWLKPAKLGGTVGKALALEAFRINSKKIRYRVHIRNQGWQAWKTNNEIAGTVGKNLPIEAIEIELVA